MNLIPEIHKLTTVPLKYQWLNGPKHAQLPYQIIKNRCFSRCENHLGWDESPQSDVQGAYSTAAAGLRTAVMLVFETMLEANFQLAAAALTGIPCKSVETLTTDYFVQKLHHGFRKLFSLPTFDGQKVNKTTKSQRSLFSMFSFTIWWCSLSYFWISTFTKSIT